ASTRRNSGSSSITKTRISCPIGGRRFAQPRIAESIYGSFPDSPSRGSFTLSLTDSLAEFARIQLRQCRRYKAKALPKSILVTNVSPLTIAIVGDDVV